HAHLEMTCLALTHCVSCTVPPFESLADIAGRLREETAEAPVGKWIIARTSFGLQLRVPEERLFSRQDLDAVSEEHPIVVLASLHVGMLNTAALRELGFMDGSRPVPRGTLVHRDDVG